MSVFIEILLYKTIEIEKEQQEILLVEGATTTGQTPEKAFHNIK
jgi:predicted RNase H-like HicB family nuclease